MKKFKKLLSILLVIATVMSTCTVAFAQEITEEPAEQIFVDVSPEHKWYTGVQYLAEKGISQGVGEGLYGVDNLISLKSLSVMLCRAFGHDDIVARDLEKETFGSECLEAAVKFGWMPIEWIGYDLGNICSGAFYNTLFDVYYLDYIVPDIFSKYDNMNEWDQAFAVAKELGICSEDAQWDDLVTRGEAAHAIYLLDTKQFGEIPQLNDYVIKNNDNVPLRRYIQELDRVPGDIVANFYKKGWEFIIDSEHLRVQTPNYLSPNEGELNGLCMWSTHKIYVSETASIIHEFGHFYDSTHGFCSNELRSEMKNGLKYLRQYSQKNTREFFAEAFDYFVNYRHNENKMKIMQEATPKTYEMMLKAEENNWN